MLCYTEVQLADTNMTDHATVLSECVTSVSESANMLSKIVTMLSERVTVLSEHEVIDTGGFFGVSFLFSFFLSLSINFLK